MSRTVQDAWPQRGFTLVELMIVLAIVAIITAVAWPSFNDAVRKSRRSDAMAALAQAMQAQERWRSNNTSYQSDITALPGAGSTSAEGHYAISVVDGTASATAYTLQATVRNGSRQQDDSTCRTFQVAVANGAIVYSSTASNGNANASPDPCWVK